jgi:GAF domain-containing protein
MKRRSKASRKPVTARRRKTAVPTRGKAPKTVRHRKSPAAGRETEVARLTRELDEALARQTATAEVLRVISSSPGDLEPVFTSILDNATRICEANFGTLFLREGGALRVAAHHGSLTKAWDAQWRVGTLLQPDPELQAFQTLQGREPIQVTDLSKAPSYLARNPKAINSVEVGGIRTMLTMPMLKDGEAIGVITIFRTEVREFTDKQIALVTNFATQAVIAIENTRLLSELRESLEQQTATADVLKVISRSTFDLQAVLDTLVASAVWLCRAERSAIRLVRDGLYHNVANYGFSPEHKARMEREPTAPGPGSIGGRIAITGKSVHLIDSQADSDPGVASRSRSGNIRTMLGVPLLREGTLIGFLLLQRSVVQAFTNKEISLAETFADQAVIAIENVRLFEAEQQRTAELAESLEQQTATSEVLRVISSSPGVLDPVFQAMLENATRICEAKFGVLSLNEGDALRVVAMHNAPPAYVELRRREPTFRATGNLGAMLARAIATKRAVQTADVSEYLADSDDMQARKFADATGARSVIVVPMPKDNEVIGVFTVYRQETRPFTNKQIDVLTNFAAQAVIAIENTRLLSELRESLEQQTATAEVLGVINASRGDLQPVFEAMVEKARRLCEADSGHLALPVGDDYRSIAVSAMLPEMEVLIRSVSYAPGRGTAVGRALAERRPVQISDIGTDNEHIARNAADQGFIRTILGVPLLRGDEAIGAFGLSRRRVEPFSERQIALVQNFAAQAVIAIENTRLLSELRQSLEQQTATADVLRVISSSPGDLEPVFSAMLENATRICQAQFGVLSLREGAALRVVAMHNPPAAYAELRRREPTWVPTGQMGRIAAQAITTRQAIQVPDLAIYNNDDPLIRDFATTTGARSLILVPLLKEGKVIGTSAIYRQEVRPFTDKQVELLTNFAAQAVIAIENTRLLNELRESLEQQTATSEVLSVISSSPGELAPVFQAMLENAVRICDSKFGTLFRYADEAFEAVALFGTPPALTEFHQKRGRFRPAVGAGLERVARTKDVVHIADETAEPTPSVSARLAGARSVVVVPMLKDDELIGAISIYRGEVRPFTGKQIALVTNFAAQAVIAIENTRLLSELRESLQQQTATSEVLRVISSSPGDLEPVFTSILDNATRICEANFGTLFLREGEALRVAAHHGSLTKAWDEQWRVGTLFQPDAELQAFQTLQVREPIQVTDLSKAPSYLARNPKAVNSVEVGGIRTMLTMPMLKDGEAIGVITIFRTEVREFTDKQIALVTNFAAQAVIAIENTRLLSELRESLQQQTATSDVLKVISRATFDLPAVLNTLVHSAAKLCDAECAFIFRLEDGAYRLAANHGFSEEYRQFIVRNPIKPGRGTLVGRTALEARTVHFPDCLADPEYVWTESQKIGGFRTMLGVPLLREGNPIGVIALTRSVVRPFADKQIELIETFADQAGIAIENVRLFEAEQQRTAELTESLEQQTATAEILGVISKSLSDTQPVFDAIVQSGVRLFPGAAIFIALPDAGEVRAAAIAEADPARAEAWRRRFPFPLTRAYIHSTAILDRKMLDIPDVENAPEEMAAGKRNFLASGYRAVTIMPMMRGDAAIGALSVVRREPGRLSDKQIAVLNTFAAQAVIAIENTRLLSELRESLQQQTATADVLKVISRSTFDLQTVLDTLVESAARLCEADSAAVHRPKGDTYPFVASFGHSPEYKRFMQEHPFKPGPGSVVWRILQSGKVQVPDVLADPDFALLEQQKIGRFRTVLGVPLLREGSPIGVLILSRNEVRPFTDKQIELVETFADQAVIAIENVRLFEAEQQRTTELSEALEQQAATSEVLNVISRSKFDLQPILQSVVDTAARLCRADTAVIFKLDQGLYRFAAGYCVDPRYMEIEMATPITPGSGTVVGRAAMQREAVRIVDAMQDPLYEKKGDAKVAQVRSMIGVPLMREGEPIGVIALARQRVEPFLDREIELVSTFADQAAIAIENVRLFESVEARTRELAASLEDLRTAQDRLVQTEKLASLGQLTAGIAHEIKNPLNFVNNFSSVSIELIDELREALAGAPLDAKLRAEIGEIADMLQGNLDKVVQHGKRADSIVKNMLLHSREGSGEHRPVDINALVEESLNLAFHGARAEKQGFNIAIERAFDPAAGEVDLFPQEVTRVLLNLISNGFYAATKRKTQADSGYEPMLTAATKSLGDSVEIRIRDNGTGVPPEVKEKMFNPFFTTKPAGEGTGLGLSISHDIIVKQHGGSITVDTEPGEFTEFRIVLPRAGASLGKSELGNSELGNSGLGNSGLGNSGLGKSELGKSELGKSELGKSELGKSELGKSGERA